MSRVGNSPNCLNDLNALIYLLYFHQAFERTFFFWIFLDMCSLSPGLEQSLTSALGNTTAT
jgi:hypothetical protein